MDRRIARTLYSEIAERELSHVHNRMTFGFFWMETTFYQNVLFKDIGRFLINRPPGYRITSRSSTIAFSET